MPSGIRVGDTVFLKQQKQSKSDSSFGSLKYTVLAQDGSKVVICSENGVQYTRSINDLKKVPLPADLVEGNGFAPGIATDPNSDGQLSGDQTANGDEGHAVNRDENSSNRAGLRNRGLVKKPSRYNDNYIYK